MNALTRREERAVEMAVRDLRDAETALQDRRDAISDEQDCARLLIEQGADYELHGDRLCLDGGYSATVKKAAVYNSGSPSDLSTRPVWVGEITGLVMEGVA